MYPNIRSLLICNINLATKVDARYRMIASILTTWFKLHSLIPSTEQDVQEQSLWYNINVTIDKKPFCWRPWLHAGIVTINDILHPDQPRFLSHDELSEKFQVTVSFLHVLQIRSAIPFNWRRLLSYQANPNLLTKPTIVDSDKAHLDILKLSSKKLYTNIILRKQQNVASQRKWNLEFPPPQDISPQEYWQSNFEAAFRSVRETKLQAFQFKLLHRIIPCNKYLKNIRVVESDLCSYCGGVDSLNHFFYHCSSVKPFWSALCTWATRQINIQLENIQLCEYMLGIPQENPQSKVLNFIILSCKFYIYRQKLYHEGKTDLTAFLRELRAKLKIEKYICVLEGKADKFNRWRSILNALG